MFSLLTDTYFFTATVNSWKHLLKNNKNKEIIISSLQFCVRTKRIALHGFVIIPNHIHLLLTLGENDTTISFQRDFLRFTAQQIIKKLIKDGRQNILNNFRSTQKDRIYQIWERRLKWIAVSNQPIFLQKLNYIHQNPLQEHWQLSSDANSYYWSSAAYYEAGDDKFQILSQI